MTIFAKLGGELYDVIGATTPFVMKSACDFTFAAVIIVLYLLGKWKDTK